MNSSDDFFDQHSVITTPILIKETPPKEFVPLERRSYSRRNSDNLAQIQCVPFYQWHCKSDTEGSIQLIIDKNKRILHCSKNTHSFLSDFEKLIDISFKFTLYPTELSTKLFLFLNQREFINKSCELLIRGEDIRQILILNCYPLLTHQSTLPPDKFIISLRNPFFIKQEKWALFTQTYELTYAESKLCKAFLYGMPIQDYCLEREISQSTVRSQLSAIFLKTFTTKQSDLLRLIYGYLFL